MKKVLILGAGLVSKPMVEYLLEEGFEVIIATRTKEKADKLLGGHKNGRSLAWMTDDMVTLNAMVRDSDLTVSLLPYKYHVDVAKLCLKHRKPLVTTSYVSPAMQELHDEAVNAGVILLNEAGLDPGIDHMSAMRIIDTVRERGGKIEEFYSLCGALPAPEYATNPLGYKFSWSPKGVVLASRNGASYLKHGKIVTVDPINLFKDRFSHFFPGVGELEVYPNRDSVSYVDIYGLKGISTMYRGTFRFRGWCETLDLMKAIGLIDDGDIDYTGKSYRQFVSERAGLPGKNLREELKAKPGLDATDRALDAFEWLGLFSDTVMGYAVTSPYEITSDLMIKKMWLGDTERDMIVMQHLFLASFHDGRTEVISSRMLDFGSPATNTSIARTVALPAAMAVKQILTGKITLHGVYRPVLPEIYNPILDELERNGITMEEEYGLPADQMIK
ncbi:MAG: saccharopine dehydrogenase C-terminal domain-containing protein [Bacteroidales bacterium]|nr:saccharopine dehydrogenase C-terminal domain-containing protein [Bacteroidales bacterium]MDT8373080.1 saccharopine dehydrogenase C-terminal domain-containing protein [Bacteroidales bacterium]